MPGRKQENSEFKVTIYPIVPPADMADWSTWQAVCVPVPVPLLQYLPDLLKPLRWQGRVIGTDEEKQLFSEIWEDLITRFINADVCGDEEMPFKLRQNPANKCQLQQSLDSGLTWTLAFDYSLCRNPAQQYIVERELIRQFEQWHDAETPTDIHPSAPTETFSSSAGDSPEVVEYRKLALCAATKLYIDLYCETIKEINANVSTLANITNLALGVVVALGAAGAVFSFGTSTLAAMAIAAAVGGLGVASYSALTDGVLNDPVARSELACCMYLSLRDAEITDANFAASVDGCGGLSANAELIRSTLSVDISNETGLENQFNAFVNLLGEALRPAELGLIDDCPCEAPETWCISLTAGNGLDTLFAPYTVSGFPPAAQWTGTGWAASSGIPGRITLEGDFGVVLNLSKVEVFATDAVTSGTDNYQQFSEQGGALNLFEEASELATFEFSPEDIQYPFLDRVPTATNALSPAVPGEIFEIRLHGTGTPPEIGEVCA